MAVNDGLSRVYERILILRCQAGDELALAELIALYSPRLRLFLGKLTGKRESADDLLQETWFDAYRHLDRLKEPDAFTVWLYRIARDRAYRSMRRKPLRVESLEVDPVDDGEPDLPLSWEQATQVRTAINQLPLEQREVLALRFIDDMSYEQIAGVIGRPLGTVRSRIHYAKLALRAILNDFQNEPS